MKSFPADLLAAVRADPLEDAPRLEIAAWLEREGRANRAAIIRLQCGGTNDFEEAQRLQFEMQREGETPGFAHFARGFAVLLAVHWSDDAGGIARFAEQEPFLTMMMLELRRIESEADVAGALRCVPPSIAQLTLSNARSPFDTPQCCVAARGLLAGSKPPGVTGLFFHKVGNDGLCAGALLDAARSWKVESLGLLDGRLMEHRGVAVLGTALPLPDLENLLISHNGLRGPDVATLLSGAAFPALNSLSLADNTLGNAGAQVLSDLGRTFRNVNMSGCGIGDEGAFLLANSTALSTLEHLSLKKNRFSELGKKKLLDRFDDRVEL